jgi:hypothetical protein
MAYRQITNRQPTRVTAKDNTVGHTSTEAEAIHGLNQAGMEELTPLQRRCLDTAVMLLVNYLVSASSSS